MAYIRHQRDQFICLLYYWVWAEIYSFTINHRFLCWIKRENLDLFLHFQLSKRCRKHLHLHLRCHTWHFFSGAQERNLKRKIIVKDRSIRWGCKRAWECTSKRKKYRKSCSQPLFAHQSETNPPSLGVPGCKTRRHSSHFSSGFTFMAGGWVPIRRLG